MVVAASIRNQRSDDGHRNDGGHADGLKHLTSRLTGKTRFDLIFKEMVLLQLVDGVRSTGAMIDDLASRFAAPRELIATDVIATLDDLATRGAISL